MYVVGLTGRMGSGKSEALSVFADRGVAVFDADACVHQLMQSGTSIYDTIKIHFPSVVGDDGAIDRSRLAEMVFADDSKRQQLESWIHPEVRAAITRWAEETQVPYGVVEIPLLTPENRLPVIQRVCVVDAPDELCLERIKQRDQRDEALINSIRDKQLSRDALLALGDDVLFNDASLEHLAAQVDVLHTWYAAQQEG